MIHQLFIYSYVEATEDELHIKKTTVAEVLWTDILATMKPISAASAPIIVDSRNIASISSAISRPFLFY